MPTDPGTSSGLSLRPGAPHDLSSIAEVHLRSRASAGLSMPPAVHPEVEVRQWVADWDLGEHTVWVATVTEGAADQVVGYARFTPTWLDDLYVDPDHQSAGIGTALLDVVKAHRPQGFQLWVFVSNHPALGFYRGRGLVEVERTDGSANEEQAPDIRMAWLPPGLPHALVRD